MNLIIGLGNPGQKYEKTRHNIGFMALDKIALENNLEWEKDNKLKAQIAMGEGYLLVKPLTFMNNSGETVRALVKKYNLIPRNWLVLKKDFNLEDNLIVIHDELDLPLGKIKTSSNSSSAGHRGVQSIINHLKTKKFKRIRIGISSEQRALVPTDKFVLQRFTPEEEQAIKTLLDPLIDTIKS